MKLRRVYVGSKNYLAVALLSECSISRENDLKGEQELVRLVGLAGRLYKLSTKGTIISDRGAYFSGQMHIDC